MSYIACLDSLSISGHIWKLEDGKKNLSIDLNEALATPQENHVICLAINPYRKRDSYDHKKEGGNKDPLKNRSISPLFVSYRAA